MQILHEQEISLVIRQVKVDDETIVTCVDIKGGRGVPRSVCPKHLAIARCHHLAQAMEHLQMLRLTR